MVFNSPIPILLSIVGALALCNADTTDLYSAGSLERKTQTKVMSWTKKSTCGPVNYKSGLYKTWALDDPFAPRSTGKCNGQCRIAGPDNCKGFVFYYKKKNCLLLNYEADKSKFKPHISAACGYWVESNVPEPTSSPTPLPTPEPTSSPTSQPTPEPTKSPVVPTPTSSPTTFAPTISFPPTEHVCSARILLKFAKTPDDVPTFGTHNDYLIVTKKNNKGKNFESCCYNQLAQSWGCRHDGGDAMFENFADEYYDYIDSEEVVIDNARGGKFLLESKHFFNGFEAYYYGEGYADHAFPAQMTVFVNGKFKKKIAHSSNEEIDTHINRRGDDPAVNPDYDGYIKALLKCDKFCECKVLVWRNTTRPKDGPCDKFVD